MKRKTHKTDVRLYIDDGHKAYLKIVAQDRGISVNQLLMELIDKKYPYDKKAQERVQVEQIAEETAPASVPAPVEITDRKRKETRLAEINGILKKAYNGDTLPTDEYHRLKEEQTELRAELGHN